MSETYVFPIISTSEIGFSRPPWSLQPAFYSVDLTRLQEVNGLFDVLVATFLLYLAGKQDLDAELIALASVTSAANQLPYFTGSGTAAVTTFDPLARTLCGLSTASAWRSNLGLGTMATQSPTGTPTGSKFLRDDYTWQTVPGGGSGIEFGVAKRLAVLRL